MGRFLSVSEYVLVVSRSVFASDALNFLKCGNWSCLVLMIKGSTDFLSAVIWPFRGLLQFLLKSGLDRQLQVLAPRPEMWWISNQFRFSITSQIRCVSAAIKEVVPGFLYGCMSKIPLDSVHLLLDLTDM